MGGHGRAEAVRRPAQPALRDKTSIGALERVSLDGRTQDFRGDFGDGKAKRPAMIALVDVATNAVVGWELAPSENAVSTVRPIRTACATFGIFDRLCTDNGSAFAGHPAAGGAVRSFRRRGHRAEGAKPLGIRHHLGIELRLALPADGQAKIAERTFATLSRAIDDAPEFAGADAGHAPGAAPDASVVPVPVDMARRVTETASGLRPVTARRSAMPRTVWTRRNRRWTPNGSATFRPASPTPARSCRRPHMSVKGGSTAR